MRGLGTALNRYNKIPYWLRRSFWFVLYIWVSPNQYNYLKWRI